MTEPSTIFCDDSLQLWSFQNSQINADHNKIYATHIELSNSPCSVRQIVSGQRHCAVLVDFASPNLNDSQLTQSLNVCAQCKDDSTLRLSTLMENADEEFKVGFIYYIGVLECWNIEILIYL